MAGTHTERDADAVVYFCVNRVLCGLSAVHSTTAQHTTPNTEYTEAVTETRFRSNAASGAVTAGLT